MKFLCVGAGSIGKRHIRNLISIGVDVSDVSVSDPRSDRRAEVRGYGVSNVFETMEEALESERVDAALICSPTSLHIEQGIELARQKIHIMMEKPLSRDLEGINSFKTLVQQNDVQVLMAYIFRFSPLTDMVKSLLESNEIGKVFFVRGEFSEYLPDWHPYEDYRSFYMAEKKQGGGSILDQSHIMDLIHYLFGGFKSVSAFNGKISNLEVNADDYAELLIELKNGIIASIHTDMFGRSHKKSLEIKGELGNIFWDSTENCVSVYNANQKTFTYHRKFPHDFNLNYIAELRHFIECCKKSCTPMASLDDGIETMELIAAAEKSVKTKSNQMV